MAGKQRLVTGSWIAPDEPAAQVSTATFRGWFDGIDIEDGVYRGLYSLAVCSDEPLPPFSFGMFENHRDSAETWNLLDTFETPAQIAARLIDAAQSSEETEKLILPLRAEAEEQKQQLTTLRKELEDQSQQIAARQKELEEKSQHMSSVRVRRSSITTSRSEAISSSTSPTLSATTSTSTRRARFPTTTWASFPERASRRSSVITLL